MKLGSEYGGWTFSSLPTERSIKLISAGVGEDISFEVEFCSHYSRTHVALLDPTERSLIHVNQTLERLGESSVEAYSESGKQSPRSYDLRKVSTDHLSFLNVALWTNSLGIMLEEPENPEHVSFRRRRKFTQPTRFFQTVEIEEALRHIHSFDRKEDYCLLIKLDIEGSEIEVLKDILRKRIKPCQFLVEFDTLRWAVSQDILNFIWIFIRLRISGYILVHLDGYNTTFIHRRCNEV